MAVVSALVDLNPFVPAAVSPGDPRAQLGVAMLEFAYRNGRVFPATRAKAVAALDRSALADEPFLLAAVDAAAHGDEARAEALLLEARHRNPRNRMARLLLLDRFLRTGRSDAAGAELAVLSQLIPGAAEALAPELGRMARDPRSAGGLARILRHDAGIRAGVLSSLASSSATDPDAVLQLARASGAATPGTAQDWQAILLRRLADHGEFARAYALWKGFVGGPAAAASGGVYDGRFARMPGPPPFNWDLASGAEGTADRGPGPALQVDYYGRSALALARELVLLKPGGYRLVMRVSGAAKGEGTQLVWSVSCAPGDAALVQLPLTNVASAPRLVSAGFTVPASGCAAQWVKLDGRPGDVAAEQNASIADLQIVPAGGAR
jgi:hypothetical protein